MTTQHQQQEELHICGQTGREFDQENPLKGCGETIEEDDENVMIGNISYCLACSEKSDAEKECNNSFKEKWQGKREEFIEIMGRPFVDGDLSRKEEIRKFLVQELGLTLEQIYDIMITNI